MAGRGRPMTEAEWLVGSDVQAMLDDVRGKANGRKLVLFALGCCARIAHLLTDPRSRAALDFAGRHADLPRSRWKGIVAVRKAAHAACQEASDRVLAPGASPAACLVSSHAAFAVASAVNSDAWLGAS